MWINVWGRHVAANLLSDSNNANCKIPLFPGIGQIKQFSSAACPKKTSWQTDRVMGPLPFSFPEPVTHPKLPVISHLFPNVLCFPTNHKYLFIRSVSQRNIFSQKVAVEIEISADVLWAEIDGSNNTDFLIRGVRDNGDYTTMGFIPFSS